MAREGIENEGAICVADDLVSLAQLTDHSILNCLRERFHDDQIYTYAGDVLISLNPNKQLPLYNSRHVLDYQRTHGNSARPHIYAMAELALTDLLQNCTDQCCIMMGVSGAGKTQCTHYFTRYILDSSIMLPLDKHVVSMVKQRREVFVHSLSVTAAFSHAAVPTNTSSSRCCRFIEVYFNARMGELVGGRISMPLLEIDRVCQLDRPTDQSNFSVFYRMLYGLPEDMLKKLFLSDNPQNYGILCGYNRNDHDEAIQFRRLCIHLNSLGLGSDTHQMELCSVLAAVIHLGEVQRGVADALSHAAQLLGVELESLEKCLDELSDSQSNSSAILASLIYHNLFNYILSHINKRLAPDDDNSVSTISVLDPVGSQGSCQSNLFCLCSNYVEEVIQHLYYHKMFVWEQEVYAREAIEWSNVEFVNNDAVLSLYNEPKGLWTCLDGNTDDDIVAMVTELFTSHHDVCYSSEEANHFTVAHSVSEITYHVSQWAAFNKRNKFSNAVKSLLATSDARLVCSIAETMSKSCDQVCGKSVEGDSQSNKTKAAVEILKKKIVSSNPYFVCCLKPSDDSSKEFEDTHVLVQLQALSLLDVTLLQSRGYPVHLTYNDFVKRYSVLLLDNDCTTCNDEEVSHKIIANAKLDDWKIGKSQLLLKPWHKTELDGLLDEYDSNACTIQRAFRRHSSKKKGQRHQSNPAKESVSPNVKKDTPPAIPVKKHRQPRKSASDSQLPLSSSTTDDTYLEIFPNLPASPPAVSSPSSVISPPSTSPLVTNPPITSPSALSTSPTVKSPAVSPTVTSPNSAVSSPLSDNERRNSSITMETIMEEDEESYLAILSDSADHCVTRKRTMILSHRQAAKVAAAIETIGNSNSPPVPQRPSWAEHSVNGVDSTKVIKPLHHVIRDDLDNESWYHGNISREEAESRLKQAGVNCFLIRPSTSQSDGYALSMRNNDVIKHYRIVKKPNSGRYEIFGNSRSFPAMKVLVDYHHKCAISVDGEILSIPCPKEFNIGARVSPPPVPPRSRLASEPPPRIISSSTRYKSVSWQRNKSDSCATLDGVGNLSPKGNHGNDDDKECNSTNMLTVSLTGSMNSPLMRKSPQVARSNTAILPASSPDSVRAGGKKKNLKKNWNQAQSEFTEMLSQSFGSASHETLQELEKEISVAERFVDAASRLADLQADNKQTKKERKDHLKAEQAKLHALKQRHEKLKEHRRVQDMSEIVEKSKTHNGSFHGNSTPLHSPHSKSDGSMPPALPPRPLHTLTD